MPRDCCGLRRRRGSTGSEGRLDSALDRLKHEYQELLSENRALQDKCAAAEAQVCSDPVTQIRASCGAI